MPVQTPSNLVVTYFKPSTRVLFDWKRMRREDWPVHLHTFKKRLKLETWYVPWYMGRGGKEVGYDAPDSSPLSLSDVPRTLRSMKKRRQQAIARLSKNFEEAIPPVQITILAYALGRGRHLILDGNHRMAALAITKVDFRLMAFIVSGPIRADVLPDLRHWEHD